MFKSSFAKYFTAFVVIIAGSFLMLALIFTSMIRSYSINESDQNLRQIGYTLAKQMEELGVENLENHVTFPGLSRVIEPLIKTDAELDILITDANGRVLLSTPASGDQRIPVVYGDLGQIRLPAFHRYVDDIWGDFLQAQGTVMAQGGESYRAYARAVQYNGGAVGYIVTMKSTVKEDALIGVTGRAVITASLWVMLAALIAVYFITERIMHPLREMTAAAKKFAKGDFATRVEVYGQDEVADLGIAFNNMAESLANLETMRNSFLANVSHDLRTPMTTIAGFIDGINSGAIPPEKQEYYLGVISSEVHRLSRLVSQLLDISRLESGDRKFQMVDFDVAEVARLILISFEKQIDEKRLEVEFTSEDSVYVHADKDAIYQVIYNLCHNAIKFSKEGGAYAIRIAAEGKEVRFSVYNEGRGIPAEDLPFVFERFYKTDKSRGLDKSGVGLGLYICKTIIDAHGGKLTVRSEEGRFCEFSCLIQAADGPHRKSEGGH